ncbi:MAG TPA: LysM domain-containing protein [Rhodanobacteraceae bacterium]|nr:LysM domain-containing protein [Rhodanobacteraceae bacterium]
MLKKSLALMSGLAFAVVAVAATTTLKPGHPETYVVKQGDTLWDISARFLAKPWLWPEIWRANPQVHNPHLIYPGDVLKLAYPGDQGGGARVVLEPRARATALGEAVPAIPLKAVKPFLKDLQVMDAAAVKAAPYVVGLEENRLRATPGQFLYARGLDAQPGQTFAVVRPTHAYRVYDAGTPDRDIVGHILDSNVALVASPWKEVTRGDGHWGKGDSLGVEVQVIGTAQALRGGDPSTLLLDDATMEVRAGDRLLPMPTQPYDASFYPHPPRAALPDDAKVIAFADAMYSAGPLQVVALSVGQADGIDNGTTFAMFQPGATIHDDVASNSAQPFFGEQVTLPAEYIGHVMVFRSFNHVSYGLVMDGIRPVHLGDTLRAPD